MPITIYRWTDGPYRAFTDHLGHRYILRDDRAAVLIDRLSAHLSGPADPSLHVDRRFTYDPCRDLTVSDIFFQDCDDCFEIMTATGPLLVATRRELVSLLGCLSTQPAHRGIRRRKDIPNFVQESPRSLLPDFSEYPETSYG